MTGDNIADTSGKIAVVIISDKATKFIMGQTDGETSLSDTARDRVEKNACLAFGNYVTASAGERVHWRPHQYLGMIRRM